MMSDGLAASIAIASIGAVLAFVGLMWWCFWKDTATGTKPPPWLWIAAVLLGAPLFVRLIVMAVLE